MTEHAPMAGLPASALPALHRALAQDRPPEEAARLARQIGYRVAPAVHEALRAWLQRSGVADPASLETDAFWSRLSEFFASAGWGELAFERLHPGVASLGSGAWAEAEGRSASQPSCHVTTALLAALLGRVSEAELAALEVECRSAGDQRCRFLVGGAEALREVYGRLREGGSYADALATL